MPRGSKRCECGQVTGPRAFSCPACLKPFKIKGVEVPPEKILERKLSKQPTADSDEDEEILEVSDYFVVAAPTERELRNQGSQVRVWQSKDGKYRLRWSKEFMGVSIEHLHGKQYILLRNRLDYNQNVVLEMVRRFKTMQGSLKGYIKVINGIPFEKPEDKKVKQKKKLKRIIKGIK